MNFKIDSKSIEDNVIKFRVVLCRIRLFPRVTSKIKWLGSGLPLSFKLDSLLVQWRIFKPNLMYLKSSCTCCSEITLIAWERSFHRMILLCVIFQLLFFICTIVTEFTVPLFFWVGIEYVSFQKARIMSNKTALVAMICFAIVLSHMRIKRLLRPAFIIADITFEFRFFVYAHVYF